ncbi:MAG: CD225/dispanin family protein [Muribaculaceae bacterium]|nr:CD225/dispanin family protein [Muribaculaceae bacterium]
MKYYAMIDGESRGPYELESLADAGVRPSTYIWCKGMTDWEKAEDVAEVCRMFRNRLYDLMHPGSNDAGQPFSIKDSPTQQTEEAPNAGFTRFDRHLKDSDTPELPSIEEIEDREDKTPPPSLLIPLAIIVTIFCFPPTGIAAVYYSVKAKNEWKKDPASHTAGTYCRAAKMWTGISFFLGMILYAFIIRFFC